MIYGLAAVAGQPSGTLPPPHPHLASPMKGLLSLLMWQLPAAQELYWQLSTPSPHPNVLTLNIVHSFAEIISSTER